MALTAFVLALAIGNGLHLGRKQSGWLLPLDYVLQGWPLLAANIAFYAYLWWIGFWFVYRTQGRERLFMIGWFASVLLGPVESLRPQWGTGIKYIVIAGLTVAFIAASSLFVRPLKPEAPVLNSED